MKLYVDLKPEQVWVDRGFDVHQSQDYWIGSSKDPSGRVVLFILECMKFMGGFDTLSEAKAAAQADYDRRTAERFREVEVAEIVDIDYLKDIRHHLRQQQYEIVDELIQDWIDELQSAIGAGKGEP